MPIRICCFGKKNGAPGKIRTPDPLIRSQVLYPAELPVRRSGFYWLACAIARGDYNLPVKAVAIGRHPTQSGRLKHAARHGAGHTISRQSAQFGQSQRARFLRLGQFLGPLSPAQKSCHRQTAYAPDEWRAPAHHAP